MGWSAQIPELPYVCQDQACACHGTPRLNEVDQRVRFRWGEGTYVAVVVEDGAMVDAFRGHDPGEVVRQVHEQYPFARS